MTRLHNTGGLSARRKIIQQLLPVALTIVLAMMAASYKATAQAVTDARSNDKGSPAPAAQSNANDFENSVNLKPRFEQATTQVVPPFKPGYDITPYSYKPGTDTLKFAPLFNPEYLWKPIPPLRPQYSERMDTDDEDQYVTNSDE